MNKEQNRQNNTEPNNVLYTLLDEVKIYPFTGKKYNAVKKVKCTCPCHDQNVTAMHFVSCCNDGYIEEYCYID